MQITPLAIEGAWPVVPRQHGDDRGVFLEWFAGSALVAATGQSPNLAQANIATSDLAAPTLSQAKAQAPLQQPDEVPAFRAGLLVTEGARP
jgi:hypothetical protein